MKQIKFVALAIVFLFSTSAQAVFISNAGFEQDISGGTITSYFSGDSIFGWTVTASDVETVTSGFWAPSEGLRSLDLNGVNPGAISQTISGFITGATYELLFDMGGNFYSPAPSQVANVSIGAATQNFTYVPEIGDTPSSFTWKEMSLLFIATGTSQTLSFSQVSIYPASGAALDNVRINLVEMSMVSEPNIVALVLAGLLIIYIRRKLKY